MKFYSAMLLQKSVRNPPRPGHEAYRDTPPPERTLRTLSDPLLGGTHKAGGGLLASPFAASAFLLAAAAFIFAAPFASFAEDPPPADNASIVEVIASCQDFDPQLPWRKRPPQMRSGLGVVVEGNQILTAENIVRNNTLVEFRRVQSGTKSEAKVLEADYQINAALLKTGDTNEESVLKPLPIADKVLRNDTVTIVKMDESGQFQHSNGEVIEVISSAHALILKVLTDLSVEKAGTPLLIGDKLAGIVIKYDKTTQTCLAIAASTLKKFVDDVNTPPYAGSAWAGLFWEPLLDPAKQKYLGLAAKGGVLVLNTMPGSGAASVLKPDDVILDWDGCQLDELGYYADPDFGRLLFSHLVSGRRNPGESASATILRDRKRQSVQIPLKRHVDADQIIPENILGARSEYLIEGGLILRELSGDYLQSAGNDWVMLMNARLVHYYFAPWQFSSKPGEHVVILSSVLPDQINVGYQEMRNEVVTAVNGRQARNLADVFAAVDRDGGLKRITLMGYGVDLVLDENEIAPANRRIAANYRIPSLRYQRGSAGTK